METPASRKVIKVSKLDAAVRQTRTAIKLWFMEDDPVSIHTLAAASHEIIHTLFKRKGLTDLLFDSDLIKDEFRGEFAKRVKADATFFKHAQRDPDGFRDFKPDANLYLLLFSTSGLHRMGVPQSKIELTFLTWLGIKYPQYLYVDVYGQAIPHDDLDGIRRMKPWDFFEMYTRKLKG